jgi:hypothetical protein
MNTNTSKLKKSQDLTAGDKFTDYEGEHLVLEVLSPQCVGSWDECTGTGFPRLLCDDGKVRMLPYGQKYAVAENQSEDLE